MRFDDMLATVMAQPRDTAAARISLWRQLVDVLAQREDVALDPEHVHAFALLDEWQRDVPFEVRLEAARSLAGRRIPAWLCAHFAEDAPEIARPVLLGALLDPEDWIELLPQMRGSSRALLRHRGDLDPRVGEALGRFGAADMVLESRNEKSRAPAADILELGPSDALPDLPETDAPSGNFEQIRTLVERIEAFRKTREGDTAAAPRIPVREFRFEAGPDGVIRWVDGAPRGPLIGQTIAFSADALDFGVDGHAAGAFRQRAPFRDARLVVAGDGSASGAWRISAVPFFGEEDGRFAGYRGMARRPRREEEATTTAAPPDGLFGSNLEPDSLRQLIHELRTPLNAIIGFAEMIDGQLLGPVSAIYRQRASGVAEEAARLLQSIEDIDTAARAETDRLNFDVETVEMTGILQRLHDAYVEQAEARGVNLAIRIEQDLPSLTADPIAIERMVERLLSSTVGLAAAGETILVVCMRDASRGGIAIAFDRPALLVGQEEDALLDPGYSPDGDWPDAPALGLGFALRLVRNIAHEADGELDIEPDKFVLHLPTKDASALPGERGR
ncbi:HAMP domain-containing histidine kinase [Parasphingopyxis algicola]|uniref:histidine kinase dimerization/phospho-acceptor domain-containing protein n=1 Tax=Parasphingopyxis algicola TaxID=2026624 RepID=UPI0015A1DEC3|nr:HAMP domain-containing sensor histidine kinase [Parasphingopyxis algicola]QLC24190.1 HAMP domain-containing histidine kinase [Parasphingopyxis algicola]